MTEKENLLRTFHVNHNQVLHINCLTNDMLWQ